MGKKNVSAYAFRLNHLVQLQEGEEEVEKKMRRRWSLKFLTFSSLLSKSEGI